MYKQPVHTTIDGREPAPAGSEGWLGASYRRPICISTWAARRGIDQHRSRTTSSIKSPHPRRQLLELEAVRTTARRMLPRWPSRNLPASVLTLLPPRHVASSRRRGPSPCMKLQQAVACPCQLRSAWCSCFPLLHTRPVLRYALDRLRLQHLLSASRSTDSVGSKRLCLLMIASILLGIVWYAKAVWASSGLRRCPRSRDCANCTTCVDCNRLQR